VSEQRHAPESPVVIKKYANRRLYNTASSTYVTLDDLARMVKEGTEFSVYDAKTGEDITRTVLTQIIFEEENKGPNLLPINFLRQLIRFYGDSMQAFVPSFLEFSIDSLARDQEKLRKQFMDSFGTEPLRALEDQAKRNMGMFQEAMKMFNPFMALGANAPSPRTETASATRKPPEASTQDELKNLREQLQAVQRQLDALAAKKD
jgi:polyhydroxyalkanoate synthesis repressor PhaR